LSYGPGAPRRERGLPRGHPPYNAGPGPAITPGGGALCVPGTCETASTHEISTRHAWRAAFGRRGAPTQLCMRRRITSGAMPLMPATIRVSLVVRQETGRKTVSQMLPDFRFAIGAALAVAVLAVTSFGLLTAVRFTHHGKPGP